ncbi:MAG: TetR/AcrR family transcriptional regulator [Bacillota bacterium]|nr:TetR/AcrR family transcriptional regulator [Bacillota bacterium]
MTKVSYHHDNLKDKLIDMGIKLLNEEGYKSFSLRKLAKACGVSHTAPYRHFRNKDEIIFAMTMKALEEFDQSLSEAVKKYPDDLKKQIMEMGFLYVKFFVENPDYLQLLFLSDIEKYTSNSEFGTQVSGYPFYTFLNSIEKYAVGQDDSFDKHAYALSCWSQVQGLALIIVKKQYPYDGDYLELARKIIWG